MKISLVSLGCTLTLSMMAAGPTLQMQSEATNVTVRFSGVLQSAGPAGGPFTNLWGAANPYHLPLSAGANQFWRSRMGGARTFAAGYLQNAAIRSDGTLWVWGFHDAVAEFGTNRPWMLSAETNWVQVHCGDFFMMALKANGTLWARGRNYFGQLGIGTGATTNELVEVGDHWLSVALGQSHGAGVKSNGTLWAWGENNYGQLGIGSYVNTNRPAQVGTSNDWSAVACGSGHTLGLKKDGSIWAWGSNDRKVLGHESLEMTNQPIRFGLANDWTVITSGEDGSAVALKADGSLWTWGMLDIESHGDNGERSSQPIRVGPASNWVDSTCGSYHVLLINANGSLQGWGDAHFGKLGDAADAYLPTPISSESDWIATAGGGNHTLAMRRDGSLWALGNNSYGQLGIGTWGLNTETNRPVAVGGVGNSFIGLIR